MFLVSLCIYYLSVSGLTYDILNSPPAFGVEMDDHGNGRPVAILQWQVISSSVWEFLTIPRRWISNIWWRDSPPGSWWCWLGQELWFLTKSIIFSQQSRFLTKRICNSPKYTVIKTKFLLQNGIFSDAGTGNVFSPGWPLYSLLLLSDQVAGLPGWRLPHTVAGIEW